MTMQDAFNDGYKLGMDHGKMFAEEAVNQALDLVVFRLGEKATIQDVKEQALRYIDSLWREVSHEKKAL